MTVFDKDPQNTNMPKSVSLIIRFALGALIILGAFVVAKAIISSKPERPIGVPPTAQKLVEVLEVQYSINNFKTPVQGRVQSKQNIELFSEVSGPLQIGGKEFREGQEFSKGEAILKMDPTDQRNQVRSLRSSFLQLLTSNLADLKIDYPASFPNWKQYAEEFDVNSNLKALPEGESQQEKLFLSNRGVLNQYYNIKSAEDRLAKFTLRAPFNGKVTEALVNPGALVRVGQKMGAFASSGKVEVEAAIGIEALNYLEIGDDVIFQLEKDTAIGTVKRISSSLDPATQTQKVFIEINQALTVGSYVSGFVTSSAETPSMKLDSDLINREGFVYAVEDGVLVKYYPEILQKNGSDALVFGLPEGLKLIAKPIATAFEGMEVKINEQ